MVYLPLDVLVVATGLPFIVAVTRVPSFATFPPIVTVPVNLWTLITGVAVGETGLAVGVGMRRRVGAKIITLAVGVGIGVNVGLGVDVGSGV